MVLPLTNVVLRASVSPWWMLVWHLKPETRNLPLLLGYTTRMKPDDLAGLKDDMAAYIAALGLQRFSGFIPEDTRKVLWCAPHEVSPVAKDRPEDGWKEFLELAKSSGIHFIVFSEQLLLEEDLEGLEDDLGSVRELDANDRTTLARLRIHEGQTGSLQLGFAYQGLMFVYETTAEWFEDFRLLRDSADEFADMILDSSVDDETDED